MSIKRIVVVTTGGTIASRNDASGDHKEANVTGEDLLSTLHERPANIEVVVDEFSSLGSYALSLNTIFDLAKRIEAHLNNDAVHGVVVTHGTDTMEETSYLADLIVQSEKPIVFTGAQRAADVPDSDGPRNLADAIRLAASDRATGLGAVIIFEQDFHAARDVTKTHTSRVDTFASGEHGKLGEVDEEIVSVFRKPTLRKKFQVDFIETRVDLIKLVIGADDRFIRYSAGSGAKAIVLECFGRGNATPIVARAVAEIIAAGTPVIVTSRSTQGRVRPIYGLGGGRDLERAGAIFAGDLQGPKARILVSVLLAGDYVLKDEIGILAGN